MDGPDNSQSGNTGPEYTLDVMYQMNLTHPRDLMDTGRTTFFLGIYRTLVR